MIEYFPTKSVGPTCPLDDLKVCVLFISMNCHPQHNVKHEAERLHLRKFLHPQNMFLSITVLSHKLISHRSYVYRLVVEHVRVEYSL